MAEYAEGICDDRPENPHVGHGRDTAPPDARTPAGDEQRAVLSLDLVDRHLRQQRLLPEAFHDLAMREPFVLAGVQRVDDLADCLDRLGNPATNQ